MIFSIERIYNKIIHNSFFLSFAYMEYMLDIMFSTVTFFKNPFCFKGCINNDLNHFVESTCFYRMLFMLIVILLSAKSTQFMLKKVPNKYLNKRSVNIHYKWLVLLYFPLILMVILLSNHLMTVFLFSLFFNLVVCLFIIDIKMGYLPDILTYPLLWGGLLYQTCSSEGHVVSAIYAVIISYLSITLLTTMMEKVRQRPQMGRGDFKLIAACAAWLGVMDLPFFFALAASLGGIYYVVVCFIYSNKSITRIPFGPAIIVSASYWLFSPLMNTFIVDMANKLFTK